MQQEDIIEVVVVAETCRFALDIVSLSEITDDLRRGGRTAKLGEINKPLTRDGRGNRPIQRHNQVLL